MKNFKVTFDLVHTLVIVTLIDFILNNFMEYTLSEWIGRVCTIAIMSQILMECIDTNGVYRYYWSV
jgi:hypothetical protein